MNRGQIEAASSLKSEWLNFSTLMILALVLHPNEREPC